MFLNLSVYRHALHDHFKQKKLKKNSVSHHSIPSPRASLMAFVASNVDIVQRPGRTQCYVRGIRRNKCNRYLAHRHRKTAAGRIRRCNLPGSRGELDTVKKNKMFLDVLNTCWNCWTYFRILFIHNETCKILQTFQIQFIPANVLFFFSTIKWLSKKWL